MNGDPLRIEAETVYDRYDALADRVATEEAGLLPELPITEPSQLHERIRGCIADWQAGRKSLRTLAVANALAYAVDSEVSTSCLDVLVSLDVVINVLDDIIDDVSPDRSEKIRYTANAAFATTLLHSSIPEQARDEASQYLFTYFTQLFQTPKVEADLLAEMRRTADPHERVTVAADIYQYRGRTIDAFVRLALLIYANTEQPEMASTRRQRFTEDLRTHQARRLLFKDIYDIQRDYTDDDVTPVLAQLDATGDPERVADFIAEVAERLTYSGASRDSYRDVLLSLEGRPDSLVVEISRQMDACSGL